MRSGTLDIKQWISWNYENNLCLICELKEETIDNLMDCQGYGTKIEDLKLRDIYKNDTKIHYEICE